MADRDDHRGHCFDSLDRGGSRVDECAEQAQGLEVETTELNSRLPGDIDVGLDLVARSDHEQDPP